MENIANLEEHLREIILVSSDGISSSISNQTNFFHDLNLSPQSYEELCDVFEEEYADRGVVSSDMMSFTSVGQMVDYIVEKVNSA